MKKHILLFLITCISVFSTNSQNCPLTGFSDATSLYFFYDSGTSLCVDRPTIVSVEGNDFTLVDCGDIYSVYDLVPGAPLSNPNLFEANFGFATCEYTNGVLTDEQLLSIESISQAFKGLIIYPNPLTQGNLLNIKSNLALKAAIKLYSVNGKLILSNYTNSLTNSTLNTEDLPNGIYFINIESEKYSITKKLVVMR